MEIDLKRASSTLRELAIAENTAEELVSGLGAGKSGGSFAPLQIIARASVARPSCDWDNDAILSRSCLLILHSLLPVDSFFALLTSCETWGDRISGKLCHKGKCYG